MRRTDHRGTELRNAATGDAQFELIDDSDRAVSVRGSTDRRIGRWVLAGVVLAYAGFLWLAAGADVRAGELYQPIDPHLGDPFAVDWIALEGPREGPSSYERPLPMASTDATCVGFGRLDWPESARQPTVAYCNDPATAHQLPDRGVTILTERAAGADTWYLVLFGKQIRAVEATIDGPSGSSDLAPERIYIGGRNAGILAPTGPWPVHLVWQVSGGTRYECTLAQGLIESRICT